MALLTNNLLWDILLSLVLTVLTLAIYTFFTRNNDYWKKRNVPYIKPTPIVGNFGGIITGRASIYEVLTNAYNQTDGADYCGIWLFSQPALVLRTPDMIKQILIKDFNCFSDRSITCDIKAEPVVAHTLFIAKNPLWRSLRMKITPVFTSTKLRNMVPLMNVSGRNFVEYLYENAANGPLDSRELCAKYATDVLTSCAFGVNAKSFTCENATFRNIGRQLTDFTFGNGLRLLAYFLSPRLVNTFKFPIFERRLIDFLAKAFWNTIEERKKNGTQRGDLIDIIVNMLETKEFENEQALAQAIQFFLAGFETTALTVSNTLFELARHQEYQTRLREELKEVTAGNLQLDYETIQSFTFLNQVISETLRMYPVLPFLDRQCLQEYQVPNSDLVIEKGTNIYVPVLALHHDEQYFPNPKVFDPERFNDENSPNITPYSYLPFGVGLRNCIGERFGLITSKLGIIHVISTCKVDVCDETPKEFQLSKRSFIMQPIGEVLLKFTPLKMNSIS